MRKTMMVLMLGLAGPVLAAEGLSPTAAVTAAPLSPAAMVLTHDQAIDAYYDRAVNQGDLDAIDALFDEGFETDAAFPGMKKGREGLKGFLRQLRSAFPDAKLEVTERISSGDSTVCRYRFTGTQTGKFLSIRPTKKKGAVTGVDIWEFKDGKIAAQHGNFDSLGLLVQLGIIPDLK